MFTFTVAGRCILYGRNTGQVDVDGKFSRMRRKNESGLARALRRTLGTIREMLAQYIESLPMLKQRYKSRTRRVILPIKTIVQFLELV